MRASHPDGCVERVRTPEDFAARPVKLSSRGVPLRGREVPPIIIGEPQLAQSAEIMDGWILIASARFKQLHLDSCVEEATGHDRSCRPGTDHDG